jgi:transcriptional regulator
MKKKIKEPSEPVERCNTIRRHIVSLLEDNALSAKDISLYLRIQERDVSSHLEHIQKTLNKNNQHLKIVPAQCGKCGFIFIKRTRLTKPGKCPVCRGTLINPPLFSIYVD